MKVVPYLKRQFYFSQYNFRPFRPTLVASHVFKRALSRLGLRKGFRIIDLAITYECDLQCQHCSALIMKRDAPTLTLDDYREIVQQAKGLDVLSWNVTGGEPLLVEWLDELIPVMEPRRHYISIQTNCSMLDEARARRLAKLGVNCITTSLDSYSADEHNAFRGSGESYRQVLEGVRNARKAGMQALIAATVTHQNLREEGTVRLIELANKLGAVFLFNLAIPCGQWKGRSDVVLRGDDRKYLLELLDKYPMTSTDHEVGRNRVGCPAGMEKVYITPYGDVTPCPFIHIAFGNVLTASLADIVARMRKAPHFGAYQDICVAAEDLEFQEQVMAKVYSLDVPCPVPYQAIYGSLDDE